MYIFKFEAFIVSFGLIFLAELGDKTQLTVISLSAQKKSPFRIGLSASIGISAVAIIGIIIGYVFSITVPEFWIKIGAIIIFYLFGIYTLVTFREDEGQSQNNVESSSDTLKNSRFSIDNQFLFAFISVFLMEFGDKTQIMTITMTANYLAPIEVGLGAILSLSSLCFIGAYLGDFISKKISKKWLNIAAGTFFIVMGSILLIELIYF